MPFAWSSEVTLAPSRFIGSQEVSKGMYERVNESERLHGTLESQRLVPGTLPTLVLVMLASLTTLTLPGGMEARREAAVVTGDPRSGRNTQRMSRPNVS